jgi:hypothetical protein
VDLGDKRLNARVVKTAAAMVEHPEASLPEQFDDPHQTKAVYRMLHRAAANPEALTEPHRQQTLEEARRRSLILLVQDTTEVSYGPAGRRRGLGPVGHGDQTEGFLLHTTMAIDPLAEEVIGIAHLQMWVREPVRPTESQTKRRAREDRESLKWSHAIEDIGPSGEDVTFIHVMDREGDVWETLCAARQQGVEVLVRACGSAAHRKAFRGHVSNPGKRSEAEDLVELVRATPAAVACSLERAGGSGRAARTLKLQVSFADVTILPPRLLPRETDPLALSVVRVWEEPSAAQRHDEEPVEWILLTTMPVRDAKEALRTVAWYRQRWTIEEYHKCLKTGCRLEQRQLQEGTRLIALAAMLSIMALRLLKLRDLSRLRPEAPATEVASELHVTLMCRKRGISRAEMTCYRFKREVARLGGFFGRKSDGEPGWQTLWKGWRKLNAMVEGAQLIAEPGLTYG